MEPFLELSASGDSIAGSEIRDGHAAEDASLANTALIDALRNGGDLQNTLGDFPSLADPRHANACSPLWDAQFGEWSKKAIDQKLNTRHADENQILNLAATRPDLLSGPGGAPYGSVGFVINCPIIGFQTNEPTKDLVDLVPKAQAKPANQAGAVIDRPHRRPSWSRQSSEARTPPHPHRPDQPDIEINVLRNRSCESAASRRVDESAPAFLEPAALPHGE